MSIVAALLRPSSLLRAGALLLALTAVAHAQTAPPTRPYMDFGARYLAVLSDGDMLPTAYIDDQLGTRSPWGDRLTLIPVVDGIPRKATGSVFVSNAVTGWPSNLAIDPAARFAYVTETDQKPPPGATRRDQLVAGPNVAVIDLADPSAPKVVQTLALDGRTQSAQLSPDGRHLLVGLTRNKAVHAVLIPVGSDGRLGAPKPLAFPGLDNGSPHVEWHPSGRFVSATFGLANEARFYRVIDTDAGPTFEPWGDPVVTGKFPGVGHFTPDGRHLLVTNLYWFGGADDRYVGSGSSTLAVVRFADAPDAQGKVVHTVVDTAAVGGSSEEFAISPDGRRVVSLDMRRTFLPLSDPRRDADASLTLLDFDPATGRLTPLHTAWFEGVLPEGIAFDASGRHLAVANFVHANPTRPTSETTVDIWRLLDGPAPRLVQTDVRIAVPRGAHVVRVIR